MRITILYFTSIILFCLISCDQKSTYKFQHFNTKNDTLKIIKKYITPQQIEKKIEKIKPEKFNEFKNRLIDIIDKRDTNLLKGVLYDTVFESNDICGYPGCTRKEFFKFHFSGKFGFEDWELLREAVDDGFRKIKESNSIVQFNRVTEYYQAPSFHGQFDINKELLILKENTIIKSKPTNKSKTIKIVSEGSYTCNCCIYNQNKSDVIEDTEGNWWTKIKLGDHKFAYVMSKNTSQKQYKIITIGRVNNKWKIISYLSGEPC